MTRPDERLLLFGGLPTEYLTEWEITSDLSLAEARLGVHFETIIHDALLARFRSLDGDGLQTAAELAEGLVDGASSGRQRMPAPPEMKQIVAATQLYVAMNQITEERRGDAVTIACWPWIRGEDLPTPCVALMLFQERGIPAACQGDIDALLTMVLLKRVTGWSSFMGGAIKAQGHLGINHCVICRRMAGPEGACQAYALSSYHGRKESPTVFAGVPTGQVVTVARLTRNLEQLLLLKGTLVANQTDNSRCRNTLVIDVPDRERAFRAVKGIQQHYVVALGDHTQAISNLAANHDIDIVRLDAP
jgi:L-fucose isomerase-like protein